ncbi:OLC1v1035240C1 [Oldenlandia corymbosa var. corymbosa]|uniref:Glycosyltransferase n=1 Tax=Oldenlandia corymbosa var. corymbosa TaxID=529605 RepID=A0AAV1CT83_OLDCO|nr:OLC1v1035240C1 [Oldenlandia corymbosa var. corymbosa]
MGSHVAVLAFPFASHPSVLLHLVEKLAPASPNVKFSFFSTNVSNQKLCSRFKLLQGHNNFKSYDVDDGTPEGCVFTGNPLEPIGFFLDATPDNFKKRIAEVEEETGLKISCLLVDAFLGFSADFAHELGIPWLAFWTAGPRSLSVHIYTDEINRALASAGGEGGQSDQDMALDFLPGMEAIHVSDLPYELLEGHLDKPFPKMLYNMIQAIPRATAVVINSFEGMDTTVVNDLRSKLEKVLTIGPLVLPSQKLEDELGCLSWLDSRETASVAYISFGTFLRPPPDELLALAEAIEEKQIPYLWSFRNDPKNPLLDGFLERTNGIGKVVPWTPQLNVLAHSSIGVFVTHCGWSSVMEGVACGVPMICRPFFGDQKLNRRVIEDVWQIGVGIEGGVFTKKGMVNALDLVYSSENGSNKMRCKLNELKENAMKAVDENGSSSENFKTLLDIVTSRDVS